METITRVIARESQTNPVESEDEEVGRWWKGEDPARKQGAEWWEGKDWKEGGDRCGSRGGI